MDRAERRPVRQWASSWTDDASLGGLRTVLDPRDEGGFKNQFIHRTGVLGIERILPRGRRYSCALDFGCGIGRLTPLLLRHAEAVVGIDANERLRGMADERHGGPRARFVALPDVPPVASPVLVLCSGVLGFFEPGDVAEALTVLRRIAGEGATFVLVERVGHPARRLAEPQSPRAPAFYDDALARTGWRVIRRRAIRRSSSLPLTATTRAVPRLPAALRPPAVRLLAAAEHRLARVDGPQDYVELAYLAEAA